jgi:hypothetical protein
VRAAIAAGYDVELQGPPVIEPVPESEPAEQATPVSRSASG